MRRLLHLWLGCALLMAAFGAAPALAADAHHVHHAVAAALSAPASGGKATTADGLKVLNDCQNHGQLTRVYPTAWLKKALSMMSSGTSQYSNCSTVLHQAVLHSIHRSSGGGGGSSSSTTIIVVIVVIVLVLLAALLAVLAMRRRRGGPGLPPDSA
jgi:MYXO-CTERM domain-containing protein